MDVPAKSGIYINFLPEPGDAVVSHKDRCVLDVALRAGVSIDHTCGGHGTCGTCLVEVISGLEHLGPRNELESEMAQDRGFKDCERLACQTAVEASLTVRLKAHQIKGSQT